MEQKGAFSRNVAKYRDENSKRSVSRNCIFFRNSGNKLNELESFRQRSNLNDWSKTFPQSWLKEPIPHYEVITSKKRYRKIQARDRIAKYVANFCSVKFTLSLSLLCYHLATSHHLQLIIRSGYFAKRLFEPTV